MRKRSSEQFYLQFIILKDINGRIDIIGFALNLLDLNLRTIALLYHIKCN